jgi:methanethiol oxidase
MNLRPRNLRQDPTPRVDRRTFLTASATLAIAGQALFAEDPSSDACCDRTYASVQDAMRSPPETLMYATCIHTGSPKLNPDYLATIDVHPDSPNFGKIIHRLPMPNLGDELHHFGWTSCSSCHGQPGKERRFLVVPGLASGRIHIIDTENAKSPRLHHVVEPDEIKSKTNLSTPHTVHCLADGQIMISMLGDANGNAPGGFLLLNSKFEVVGRWEKNAKGMKFNYDYWYQPRLNFMISSEWAAPKTVAAGFKLEDVQSGKYGQQVHIWDWNQREIRQTIDLGAKGMIPLEVRVHHAPDSRHAFVGAALSSTLWHLEGREDKWSAASVVEVPPVETKGWPFPVPGLITDLVLSLDDKWLYFSNWLHGDIRQYDVSDPAHPRLAGQIWLGGVIGHPSDAPDLNLAGGPQMLQLSLDGQRLYFSNSLYSPWDNQFYPQMASRGSSILRIDCDTDQGGLKLHPGFHIDFGKEPDGPARAHEMRFPGGDCTSDIWS